MRETPTSRMLARYRKPEPAWMEPARIVATVIWAFSLALHNFCQNYWLTTSFPGYEAFSQVSIRFGTKLPLWYASYAYALAVAMAFYLVSHLYWSWGESALTVGLRRSGRTQIVATLCLAVCAYVLYVRIAPIHPMMTNGVDRLSPVLLEYRYGDSTGWSFMDWSGTFAWIGLLAVLTVFVRGWGLLPMLAIARTRFLLVGLALGSAGLLFPIAILPMLVPNEHQAVLNQAVKSSPLIRGLVYGDEAHGQDARQFLAAYLQTHNDDGLVIPQWDADRNRMPVRGFEQQDGLYPELCELCQIPGVPYWTTRGVSLRFLGEPLPVEGPDLILEIPRAGWYFRQYDPETDAVYERRRMEDLPAAAQGKRWLVLKFDQTVDAQHVADTLSTLADIGVGRVDLAVVSYGFAPLSNTPVLLKFQSGSTIAAYAPVVREVQQERSVIIVKKYSPPSESIGPHRQQCGYQDRWERLGLWRKFLPQKPGTLEGPISIQVSPDLNYGHFVQYLAGAVAGGAESVKLFTQEEDQP